LHTLNKIIPRLGVKAINKRTLREDVTKILTVDGREEKCPRFNQIRYVAFFNVAATGPSGARALTRKLLGNEEFCLQIDAHTTFVSNWDELAKTEWKNAKNEFAILSTAPANVLEMSNYESWTGSKKGEVPRQCVIRIADNEIPVRTDKRLRISH
jgi:Glycosyltransferase (GlcNAc)